MDETKYVLHHGYHRGTMMSRDSTSETFDSYEEAYNAYLEHRSWYHRIGYQIWFADIVSPDGTKTHLESNPYS